MLMKKAHTVAEGTEPEEAVCGSSVKVQQEDTVGVVFMSIVALSLLAAFLRAEARNRSLLAQLARLGVVPEPHPA